MNRREFAKRALASSGTLVVAGTAVAAAEGDAERPRNLPFSTGRPIKIDVRSPGVTWNGSTFHLVSLGRAEFSLDRDSGALSAEVRGGVTTFDEVRYDVSGAVFDEAGNLLGTARAECEVPREWLGKCLTMQRTLTLDFGVSLDYARAKTFAIAISNRKVLTPDQWQKAGGSK